MNTVVTFPLAKLLKEKGFTTINTSYSDRYYNDIGEYKSVSYRTQLESYEYEAPTIAEVVTWLYEKHNVWVCVKKYKDHAADVNDPYYFTYDEGWHIYNTPTEAYLAAIEYTLSII